MARPEFISRDFPDDVPFKVPREWTRANWVRGCICPLCKGKVKRYKRPLYGSMAASLIRVYRAYGTNWGPLDPILPRKLYADNAKLRWWGLLEPQEGVREDGSRRVGIWRVTTKGEQFILKMIRVPRRAFAYNNECLGFDDEMVTIEDCLGDKFDYRELMGE